MQNFKTLLEMISQLKTILDSSQKKRCIWVFFWILIGSVFEMLGISILLPFLQSLISPEQMMENELLAPVVKLLHIETFIQMMVLTGTAVILLYIIKNLVLLYSTYVQNVLSTSINREMSTLMLGSYMNRTYSFFLDHNSADVLRGVNADVTGVYNIILNVFKLLTEIMTCLAIAVMLFVSDWFMALGVVLLAGVCFFIVVLGFKSKMRDMGVKQRISNKACNKHAYQAVNGIKEITVMQRRENFVRLYDEAADVRRATNLIYNFVVACPNRIIEAVCVSGLVAVVCVRIIAGVDTGEFIPQLGVFAVAAFKILPSVSNASGCISSLVFYRPTLEEAYVNITSARALEQEQQERTRRIGMTGSGEEMSQQILERGFCRKLSVRNMTWKYKRAKDYVLQDLSLEIEKGESVAFIGSSGAGKTTLADIILGLLRPEQGSVEMDGIDIFAIPKAWAQIIGYVPQSVFLIDDTIRNNISFGLLPGQIDDEKVWKALEQAQLAEFVRELPQGLDTIVGERGVKFSGGQRQRVAIARALYNDPDILVLDEATSALDSETETAVMDAIDKLQGQKTLIIVAHRLTTIRNCDKIYEIGNKTAVLRDKEEVLAGI